MIERPSLELHVIRRGTVVHRIGVTERLTLGRDPANDLVLVDDGISAFHAVIGRGDAGPQVADLRSTNGTFLNGQRLDGPLPLAEGDVVEVGTTVRLHVVRCRTTQARLAVLDEDAGMRFEVRGDRMRFGASPDCDVVIEGAQPVEAELVRQGATLRLGDATLATGDTFRVAGRTFRVRGAGSQRKRTVPQAATGSPYEVTVAVGVPGGPIASFRDLTEPRSHQVSSSNRASLVVVLARRLDADRTGRGRDVTIGWVDDHDVEVGVWGRGNAARQGALNLLLHRLRKELEKAGFDGACIQRKRGATRLWVHRVVLEG